MKKTKGFTLIDEMNAALSSKLTDIVRAQLMTNAIAKAPASEE